MKKLLLLFSLLFIIGGSSNLFGQVVVYTEAFDGPTAWTLNTDLGAEGTNPNVWYISCEEDGAAVGDCGTTGCTTPDQTLHIGTAAPAGDMGATYGEIGGGVTTTDRRASSGDISTIGHVDLTLSFDMIGGGNANDYAEVFYSIDGGGSWVSLDFPLTSLCCGGVPCDGMTAGLWENKTYALPAACEGIPNLRISFVWQSLDDDDFTNPSFAVNNVQITKPVVVVPGGPTALFTPEDNTICQGDMVTYTDASTTGDVITDWNWVFDGGTPATATGAGPHNVVYTEPGAYTTTLTVTDGIGSNDTSFTVTVNDGSYAGEDISENLCAGETLDLNTILSDGADAGGTWTETTMPASGAFTAGTGVLDASTLPIGGVFTFQYETPDPGAPCPGTDISIVTITIVDCPSLFASFNPSETSICQGDCITFTNESTGPIIGYAWTFSDGAIPGPITSADPGAVCFPTVGDIDVTLTITDGAATEDTVITITVNPVPEVTATASETTVCIGDEVTLTGGGADTYTWSGGATDGVPIAVDATTNFTVVGENAFGCSNNSSVTVTAIECDPLSAGFDYNDIVCLGDCAYLTDTSGGEPVSWLWDFGGAASPWASTAKHPFVCFEFPGVFDIQLTVTNALGETSSTTSSITVFPKPTVTAKEDTIIDLGQVADLMAEGSIDGGTYLWEPDIFLECDTCKVTTASPPDEVNYVVTLTDINGCSDKDTVRVFVNFIEAINVPDAFSPNRDGNNDVLYVKGLGLEQVTFRIYNKYGERVFESFTQDIGWDGKFHGRDQNPGVFTYVVEYKYLNGRTGIKKGNVTLIR